MKPTTLTILLACTLLLAAGCTAPHQQRHLRTYAEPPEPRPTPAVADRHRSNVMPAPAQQALRRQALADRPDGITPWYDDWRDRRPTTDGAFHGPVVEHSTTWITDRQGHVRGRSIDTHRETTRRVRHTTTVR